MSEARELAEQQLELAIKDVLSEELAACWSRFQEDAAVSDPEAEMSELAEWFAEQVQAAIADVIEQDPLDDEYSLDDDDDDSDDDDDDDDDDDGDSMSGDSMEEE